MVFSSCFSFDGFLIKINVYLVVYLVLNYWLRFKRLGYFDRRPRVNYFWERSENIFLKRKLTLFGEYPLSWSLRLLFYALKYQISLISAILAYFFLHFHFNFHFPEWKIKFSTFQSWNFLSIGSLIAFFPLKQNNPHVGSLRNWINHLNRLKTNWK